MSMSLRRHATAAVLRPCAWALAALAALLLLAQPSAAQVERKHCDVCGRFWDSSPSRISFKLVFGKHMKSIIVCSPFCYCERLERHPDVEPVEIKVCYFPEAKDRLAGQIPVEKAAILYGVKGELEYSAAPFIAAFRSREEARKAQTRLGGELVSWETTYARCKKLASENDKPEEDDMGPVRRPR